MKKDKSVTKGSCKRNTFHLFNYIFLYDLFFIFFLQTCDGEKSVKIATHPSEPTMVSETPRNQCSGLCIKMTIIIIAIIYPRHLFYSTNASGAKKIPETKSQSNLTRQNDYLQHCSREFEHRTNKNKSS